MKLKILLCLLVFNFYNVFAEPASETVIDLARKFSKDLFEGNGVSYMDPVVRVINSTSNSRFYTKAYVPRNSEKLYFRVGIHGMAGIVNEDLKNYKPSMPGEEFNAVKMSEFISYNPITQQITRLDTADLIHYIFLNMMYDGTKGNHAGLIQIPAKASTALGTGNTNFHLSHETMKTLFESHPLYGLPVPQSFKDSVMSAINSFPEVFTLYGGRNLDVVTAAIPQVELGSLFGTELLLRGIPPVYLGETIGDFAFWGIGLKHSISQYFYDDYNMDGELIPVDERPFDLAVQLVYQGTFLKNKIGATNAELNADANIFSCNIHASKSFKDIIDVYTGLSYETIEIKTEYTYRLQNETQKQLGLLAPGTEGPTPGYPGDTKPQTSKLTLEGTNVRWTFGVSKPIGNFDIFLDYSVSSFDIFSGGLQYRF